MRCSMPCPFVQWTAAHLFHNGLCSLLHLSAVLTSCEPPRPLDANASLALAVIVGPSGASCIIIISNQMNCTSPQPVARQPTTPTPVKAHAHTSSEQLNRPLLTLKHRAYCTSSTPVHGNIPCCNTPCTALPTCFYLTLPLPLPPSAAPSVHRLPQAPSLGGQ